MTLRVPDSAEQTILNYYFSLVSALSGGHRMKLFTNDVESGLTEAQKEALTGASFTEATFTGYSAAIVTGWSFDPDDPTVATSAERTFTRTSTGATQNVRGYYITEGTGNTLSWYEYFPGPIAVTAAGDRIQIVPRITIDDDQEATVTARGIVARQVLTSTSSSFTGDGVTDMVLNNVSVVAGRLYGLRFHSHVTMNAAGRWDFYLRLNGVNIDLLVTHGDTAAFDATVEGMCTWIAPVTQATDDFAVWADEVSGTSTMALFASATLPRTFEIFDLGQAP